MLEAHFLDRSAPRSAGIVDQDVEAAEFRDGLVDHCANLIRIFDVAGKSKGLDAELSQLVGSEFAALFFSGTKDKARPHLGQALSHLAPERRGKIINIASVAGLQGAPPEFQAIGYHASKGGVIAFTKDLACKWGVHNIQVNAIAPGWFPTRMSEVVIERNKEAFVKRIPLGRFGSDHDLKGAAVFLASGASDFVTGHVLVVDGGQTA